MNKKILLTLCLVSIGVFQTGEAWAFLNIRDSWRAQYPTSTSSDTVNCQLCHVNANGGDPWNDYGWAVRVQYYAGDQADIIQAFLDVEGDNSDSDPAGSFNIDEIQANTQPGWTPGSNNTTHFKGGGFTLNQEPPAELAVAGIVLDPGQDPDIVVTPSSIDFSQVKKGRSADLDVQIENTGLGPLEITSINLCNTPTTSTEFSWTPLSNSIIGPSASETLTITFSPTNTGLEAGCIEINSDDPDQSVNTVDVSGEGVNKVSGGGGNPGGGGTDTSKVFVTKALVGEDGISSGIAENGETLTYSITLMNTSKNEAIIDVTEIVPTATIHTGADGFTCAAVTAGSTCDAIGVVIPGKVKGTNGETVLTFQLMVDTPFIDIQNVVSVVGVDCALAENTCTVSIPPEPDVVGPVLTTLSPTDGTGVIETGFTVNGTATDAGGIASVVVNDGSTDHPTTYNSIDNTWTVDLGAYPVGMSVTLTVTATDTSGNQTVNSAIFVTIESASSTTQVRHLINRISYGITPSQLADLNGAVFDLTAYRAGQLNPTGCLESDVAQEKDDQLTAIVEGFFDLPGNNLLDLPIRNWHNLSNYAILMAAYNPCQLREVLTQFWDNHFNTRFNSVNSKSGAGEPQTTAWELAENDAFRANALGNFRNLVEISAMSPAMLYYLDGVTNTALAPNENYGRELMELHTLSVDGGYISNDVENVSIAFTGWGVAVDGVFTCNVDNHNFSAIPLDLNNGAGISVTIPVTGGCTDSGLAVIDTLVNHPSTGEFICEKLTELLVSDQITPAVVSACKTTFAATIADSDQIAQVVETILTTTEFTETADYLDKVKTPLELTAGYLRNFNIVNTTVAPLPVPGVSVTRLPGDLEDLRGEVSAMGMSLFQFSTPDGFPEQSVDWVNSGLMQRRFAFISDMAFNTSPTNDIYLNLDPADSSSFFNALNLSTADEIVDYLMVMALQGQNTDFERSQAIEILDQGTLFAAENAAGKENKLRILFAVVLNNPTYQYQ